MKKAYGFTIVELLIVIVVIAILAALSYVGYAGVSNQANDSVIQSDIAQFVKKVNYIYAEFGAYPEGGVVRIDSITSAPGSNHRNIGSNFTLSAAKESYSLPTAGGSANLIYCTGPRLDTGELDFSVSAQSASGRTYQYDSDTSELVVSSRPIDSGVSLASTCADFDYPRAYSYGYTMGSGWAAWTD